MRTSRRGLLLGAGGSLLTAALAGCGRGSSSPSTSSASSVAPTADVSPGLYPGDLMAVAVGAALDALLVQAYDLALVDVAGPAPFAAYLTAARSHHAAHAAAWTRQLTSTGAPPLSADRLRIAQGTLSGLREATDATAVASRLLALERTATATALLAVASATGSVASLAASVTPVEAQHVGVLSLLLGDPVAATAQLTPAGALGAGSLS